MEFGGGYLCESCEPLKCEGKYLNEPLRFADGYFCEPYSSVYMCGLENLSDVCLSVSSVPVFQELFVVELQLGPWHVNVLCCYKGCSLQMQAFGM